MRKSVLALTAALTFAMAGSALAGPGWGGKGGGCGMGPGYYGGPGKGQYSEQYRKLEADALPIRQQMMNKRFELQKEFLKEQPDQTAIKKINAEMGELRKKMIDLKTEAGVPVGWGGRGYHGGKGYRYHKGMGYAGCAANSGCGDCLEADATAEQGK